MNAGTIRKRHDLRRLGGEPIDKIRFDADPVYRAKVISDLDRLVELEVQVTLEGAKGSA